MSRRSRSTVPSVLLLAAASGCGGGMENAGETTPAGEPTPPGEPAWFENAAAARGIAFVYHSGASPAYAMPEIMGGGTALFDADGDGDLDAYFVQGGSLSGDVAGQPGNELALNDGAGWFTPAPDGHGADDRGYGMGVACGDVDGDGDVDLYVTNVGPDALLLNDGAGRFHDGTVDAGLDVDGWSTGAVFLDHDLDGDLDLFVCSYLDWSPETALECFNTMGGRDYCSPRNYMAPAQDRFFVNEGGRFVERTAEAGFTAFSGTGLGVCVADFDRNGWPDLFVANDGMRDQLWLGSRDGTFQDSALGWGCGFDHDGKAAAGMGIAVADLRGTGRPDVLVGNLRNESDSLFENEGTFFVNLTARAGLAAVSRRFTRFGQAFVDFDHDGHLDLFQATGRVMRQADTHTIDPYAEPDLLMIGVADGSFRPHPRPGASDAKWTRTARAAAFGDVDADGDVDVMVVNRDAPASLLLNVSPRAGGWLILDVRDADGHVAIGAEVTIAAGGVQRLSRVTRGGSYLASSDPRIHAGLGAAGTALVRVRWPDGAETAVGRVAAGEVAVIRRGE
ncbi:MAG: CRTAC1 family protein [Planctomycetota bacterium]